MSATASSSSVDLSLATTYIPAILCLLRTSVIVILISREWVNYSMAALIVMGVLLYLVCFFPFCFFYLSDFIWFVFSRFVFSLCLTLSGFFSLSDYGKQDRTLRQEVIFDSNALTCTVFVVHILNLCRSRIAHIDPPLLIQNNATLTQMAIEAEVPFFVPLFCELQQIIQGRDRSTYGTTMQQTSSMPSSAYCFYWT